MAPLITLYHNPGCSKSRDALDLLRGRGAELMVVEYLLAPPTAADVLRFAAQIGVPVRDIVRDNEPEYAAAGLGESSSDADLARAVAAHPILLQRPIAVREDGAAALGRPPEKVLCLLP